jgi:hypothetical protein
MDKLLEVYFRVSRCWNDPKLAVKEGMTVEKALRLLRRIREMALRTPGGAPLAKRANRLTREIIEKQVDTETMVG